MADSLLKERLQPFIENEGKSCSMDFGCITPEYVYRSWGGQVPLNEIEKALEPKIHVSCFKGESSLSKIERL